MAGINLSLEPEALRPLIAEVVAQTVAALEADRAKLGDRVAFSEEEAAQMLGLESHVLRDERRRHRIAASKIVGSRIRYTRADLERYMLDRRLEPEGNGKR